MCLILFRAIAILTLLTLRLPAECLDGSLAMTVSDVLRWHGFWFGVPSGIVFNGRATVVRSTRETAVLLPQLDMRVVLPLKPAEPRYAIAIDVAFSEDREAELKGYEASLRNTTRRGEAVPTVLSSCEAWIREVALYPPKTQNTREIPREFVKVAERYGRAT